MDIKEFEERFARVKVKDVWVYVGFENGIAIFATDYKQINDGSDIKVYNSGQIIGKFPVEFVKIIL